ncbi:MAG: hypothetical protein ACXWGY_01030, partial [Chthoniobacterales bacterium]
MNDVKRFLLPASIALVALLVGIAIGRQTLSRTPVSAAAPPVAPVTASTPFPARIPLPSQTPATLAQAETTEPELSDNSAADIISRMKAALGRPPNRKTYATFSKLADSIDAKNVREVLSFVETLQKPQEKSMLVSLVVGRWSEFDPQGAIAYAQALPVGTSRNWATTSAIAGWAERDTAAATAWTQQLPPGPQREQAMQTIISALA